MKVFMIGGTGLLGSEGARCLIAHGHQVTAMALPPLPAGAELPPEMEITFGNYMELNDEALMARLTGCEGLVFAAGIDERVEGPPPVYEMFRKYNITPLERLLRLAKASGVRHAVVCGSYFTHFDRAWPDFRLAECNPYICSRVDQERMALAFAGDGFDVAVLELPYIFGTQPGRKPVWVFLVEQIRGMPGMTLFPRGGTTMVTVRQVGQCICGALEHNRGGRAWPVGYYNLTWKEMLAVVHRNMGLPGRRVITIPDRLFTLFARSVVKKQKQAGHEGGLNMVAFAPFMCATAFIDREPIARELGVQPDDIEAAIGDSIRLSVAVLDGRTQAIGMKGE